MISSLHILIWEEVFLSQMIKGTRNKVKYWWENHKSLYTIPWSHQSMNEFWIPPHLLILDILTLSWKHFHFKKTFCLNLYNSNKVKGLYINLNFIEIQRYLMEWKPRILYKVCISLLTMAVPLLALCNEMGWLQTISDVSRINAHYWR